MNGCECKGSKALIALVVLGVLQLVVIVILGAVLIGTAMPKLERGVQVAERVEGRFNGFADKVEPVITAGAGKAIDAIKGMDAGKISGAATEGVTETLEAGKERAKRFFNKDKKEEPASPPDKK